MLVMSEQGTSNEVLIPDMILDPASLPRDIRDKAIDTNQLPDLRMAHLRAVTAARRAQHAAEPEPLDFVDVHLVGEETTS